MEKTGVTIKVTEPTDWVSSLVVVEKPNGKLRICLDPRDLNAAIKRPHYRMPTLEDALSKMSGAKYVSKLDAQSGYTGNSSSTKNPHSLRLSTLPLDATGSLAYPLAS